MSAEQSSFEKSQIKKDFDKVAESEIEKFIDAFERAWDELRDEMRDFSILRPSTWKLLFLAIHELVFAAEEIAEYYGNCTGEKKKSLVVNFLNDHINLPLIGEGTEAIIIGAAVDAVAIWLNRRFGHDWLIKLNTDSPVSEAGYTNEPTAVDEVAEAADKADIEYLPEPGVAAEAMENPEDS